MASHLSGQKSKNSKVVLLHHTTYFAKESITFYAHTAHKSQCLLFNFHPALCCCAEDFFEEIFEGFRENNMRSRASVAAKKRRGKEERDKNKEEEEETSVLSSLVALDRRQKNERKKCKRITDRFCFLSRSSHHRKQRLVFPPMPSKTRLTPSDSWPSMPSTSLTLSPRFAHGLRADGVRLVQRSDEPQPEGSPRPNRDRFVLSAGHGCTLQYSLMHLTGYPSATQTTIWKNFRQWDSMTPGHPENFVTDGIEVTTGPLGMGFCNAVGLALC